MCLTPGPEHVGMLVRWPGAKQAREDSAGQWAVQGQGVCVTQDGPSRLRMAGVGGAAGAHCVTGTATLSDMACNCSFRSRSSFRRVSFSVLNVCSWASWKSTWRCKDAMAPA